MVLHGPRTGVPDYPIKIDSWRICGGNGEEEGRLVMRVKTVIRFY
jgi:hypothetical protein